MSLLASMSTGNSGLKTAAMELSVVGDNIANSNTIGFKAGRAAFEDALATSVVGGLGEVGLGSRIEAVQRMLTQGALTTTGVTTDLALQGNGFFQLRGVASTGQSTTFLTRNGQFTQDKDGYLVALDGLRVQGFSADAAGVLAATSGDLRIGNLTSPPRASGNITIKANLDAEAVIPAAFDPATPGTTSNFTTGVTVYDSLGKPHSMSIYFRKNAADPVTGQTTWEWHGMVDGAELEPASVGPTDVAFGTLTFDNSGKLMDVTQSSSFSPAGAVAPQLLVFNFGDPTAPSTGGTAGTGLAGITQFAGKSTASFAGSDGYGAGDLTGVRIEESGLVSGYFSNGEMRTVGQVGVALVPAGDQLERAGENLYLQTTRSGQAVLGKAGEGGRALIASGALEQSNVDIAEQFVRMIAAQRAFEANSKTITTADQLLSELIAMKR